MADLNAKVELLPLPMQEALDFWRTKVPLTEEQFSLLHRQVKMRAFTVSGITALDVLQDILTELDRVLAEGLTLSDFRQSVNGLLERRGWEGLTPYQADNVFRTNILTAFQVGRYKQMTDPDVLDARPYWMYDAVNDARTRPAHRALDGKVYRHDNAFWQTWYPPNGFRCRCTVRTLSEGDLQRQGLTVSEDIPHLAAPPGQAPVPVIPDPGWDFNPGEAAWRPDLTKYPEELRAAYEARTKARL